MTNAVHTLSILTSSALLLLSVSASALSFSNACTPASNRIVIGGIGDFLMHKPLQNRGDQVGYEQLWKGVQYRINQVGMMYGNLETPIAPGAKNGGKIYTGYPMFNTHPNLVQAIKMSGFDVVSTANNHVMDRNKSGINLTIENLMNAGLSFTGTRKSSTGGSFSTVVQRNGFKIGFVACTYSMNGFKDSADQVLECYSERNTLMAEVRSLKSRVDAVIVTPHWGEEYQHNPRPREKQLARDLIEAGATAVIATHPHVIQPIEKYVTSNGREGFIAYSTGNFISSQGGVKKVGLMVFLGLSKSGGRTWINGVRYSPVYMVNASSGVYFLDNTQAQNTYAKVVSKVLNDDHGYLGSKERLVTNPECN